MGYFKKKLLVVLLLSLCIIFFVSSSTNATMQDVTYTVDQPTLLKEQQEYLASILIKKAEAARPSTNTFLSNFLNAAKNPQYFAYFTYVDYNNNCYINCYFIPITIEYSDFEQSLIDTDDSYFEDTFFAYPVSGYNLSGLNILRFRFRLDNNGFVDDTYTSTVFMPSSLILYQNETLKNYINGINPSESSIAMIINAIQDNTEEEEKTKEELQKLNNFMNSDSVDDDSYDMPGYSDNPTQDITQDGVNSIFTQFYETISNWDSSLIVVPIPFTGKSFNIRPDITENIVNGFANRCS